MKKELSWIPIAIVAFLSPIIGGQVLMEPLPILSSQNAFLLALQGSGEVPLLSHALLALLVILPIWWIAVFRRVFLIPKMALSGLIVLFGTFIVFSLSLSSFRFITFATISEWLVYIAAFFVACAVGGRGVGTKSILGAFLAGSTVVALIGIREYAMNKDIDATWRIFATWINSNALAGILIMGFIIGLGLVLTTDRIPAFASGTATSLIGFAIILTQSRGAFYAVTIGLILLVVLVIICPKKLSEEKRATLIRLSSIAGVLALSFFFVQLVFLSAKRSDGKEPSVSVMTRVAGTADHAREQSSGFRILLWKSGIELIRRNPAGSGMGTFRYESARPGLTTATQYAHQSFIQLGSEAGVYTPACLVLFGVLWLFEMFKGLRKTPGEMSLLRVAIVVAIITSVIHNCFDSDLYNFGTGLVFFVLLGLGLAISADGTSPEFMPRPMRLMIAFAMTVPLLCLTSAGTSKARLSQALGYLQEGDLTSAQALFAKARETKMDGEPWYFSGMYAQSQEERTRFLGHAVELNPSTKYYRTLGRVQADANDYYNATQSFNSALQRDPNNLSALLQLMQLFIKQNDPKTASQAANMLVAVEKKPYFQVRSIPEYITTETYEARIFLAKQPQNTGKRIELLRPAVQGYLDYLHTTAPIVARTVKEDPTLNFVGDDMDKVKQKLRLGIEAAKLLDQSCSAPDRREDRTFARGALAEFESALAGFERESK